MNVHDAITGRRTIARFEQEPISTELLTQLLAFGTWAPNHHLTEPWTFIVLGPRVHTQLAERLGDIQAARAPEEAPEHRQRLRTDGTTKLASVPTIVAVVSDQTGDAQRQTEDYAATCCAIQNVQLAAWAEGVGIKWSTNAVTRDSLAYELLRLDPATKTIVGFLFVGYPADIPPPRPRRKSVDECIIWTD